MNAFRLSKAFESPWRVVPDPTDRGLAANWHTEPPGPHEGSAAYARIVWYFAELTLDDEWIHRTALLVIEGIDGSATAWINGLQVGSCEGIGVPLTAILAANVAKGKVSLAVRVAALPTTHSSQIPEMQFAQEDPPPAILGNAVLSGKPSRHVIDVLVMPDIRRKKVTATITTSVPGTVRIAVEGTAMSAEGAPGALSLDLPEFQSWSPETPVVYTLRVQLLIDGATVDEDCVCFGMREFTIKENRYFLNNRPYLVKGVWYRPQPLHDARAYLTLAKQAGFNAIRIPQRIPSLDTLRAADEVGLLIFHEAFVPVSADRVHTENCAEAAARAAVVRARNHPSVVSWDFLDAASAYNPACHDALNHAAAAVRSVAREADPTRIVVPVQRAAHVTGECARMFRPFHDEPEVAVESIGLHRAPVHPAARSLLQQAGVQEGMSVHIAMGYGSMEPDSSRPDSIAERELDRIVGDAAGLAQATRDIQAETIRSYIEALRSNPKLASVWYAELGDCPDGSGMGLIDAGGKPKPVFKVLQRALKPVSVAIYLDRTNLTPRDEVDVQVTMINDDRIDIRADLSLQVVGPTNQVLWKKKRNVKLPKSGKELWSGSISASGSTGTHQFTVRIMQGMKVIAEGTAEFFVTQPATRYEDIIHVVDPARHWQNVCQALVKSVESQAPVHIVPPIANSIRAYPEEELARVLAETYGGAVTLFFGVPDDWNDLAEHIDTGITATSRWAAGVTPGIVHYAKLHPITEGLPNRTFMRQPYANVVPLRTFEEAGDEDICGSFDGSRVALEAGSHWGTHILVRRFGTGRLVFTHLRILEHLVKDPVAGKLFVNMLQHFARRSVPSLEETTLPGTGIEWLRREATKVRVWSVAGPFVHGHETVLGPEDRIDLHAAYDGPLGRVTWARWYAAEHESFRLDLRRACFPAFGPECMWEPATAYAYAEIHAPSRHEVDLLIKTPNAVKMWMNGALIHQAIPPSRHLPLTPEAVPYVLKQGRNTLLVKISAMPGPFEFAFDVTTANALQLMKWWR
ncbi:MAG: hypothetical protein AMXMBFR84_07340 [Candidatus Hydrogenedentota bacterium]